MVTDVSNSVSKQRFPESDHTLATSSGADLFTNPVIKYERLGPGGVQERLGVFNRISTLSFFLLITMTFLGVSGYYMLRIARSDGHWQEIASGRQPFPLFVANTRKRNSVYFEGTRINATPLGQLIKLRQIWNHNGLNFGLARTKISYPVAYSIFSMLGLCGLHLCLICFLNRFRRKFTLISLGYAFVGLFTFTICLITLYFSFVEKSSCYLENAKYPPQYNFTATGPPPLDNDEVKLLFVNLSYACAFAFSKANKYAKYLYPIPKKATFSVGPIKYTREEMMELGICPRQDLILLSILFLALTALFCWLTSSMSETQENVVLGPPVWLQRFKVKYQKGIRQWETRMQVPSYIELSSKSVEKRIKFEKSEHLVKDDENDFCLDDAYGVLDGGFDHVLLSVHLPLDDEEHSRFRFHQAVTTAV